MDLLRPRLRAAAAAGAGADGMLPALSGQSSEDGLCEGCCKGYKGP